MPYERQITILGEPNHQVVNACLQVAKALGNIGYMEGPSMEGHEHVGRLA